MSAETLGKLLQRLRQEAGLTQEQLAEKAGLSVHNVRNWEHDHRLPGLVPVYKLARALNVPMEQFGVCAAAMEDEGKPTSNERRKGEGEGSNH